MIVNKIANFLKSNFANVNRLRSTDVSLYKIN